MSIIVRLGLISKVCQRLDPHITIDRLLLEHKFFALADLKHFYRVLLLNVEVEQLVLQVLIGLTAINDSFFRTIDFKEEKHVMFVNLAAIIAFNQVVDSSIYFNQIVEL